MKKTLFLKTELGTVVVPRLEGSSWLGRWAHNRWLELRFKQKVQKAAPKPWKILSSMYEVKILIEENGNYRIENERKQGILPEVESKSKLQNKPTPLQHRPRSTGRAYL